nr:PREDICTED: heavy metal-associated isoprenylated plant protein 26-like [Daucus carota subsp. sativus]
MKKIELKVNMKCQKCRTEVLKAVTKVPGVDHVSANVENEVVTIIGDVDPVLVTSKVRKAGKRAEIIGVGPARREN